MNDAQAPETDDGSDAELNRIVAEEEACLDRILSHVERRTNDQVEKKEINYDAQLIELRDEIAVARLEDVPPLLEQMERLQAIAAGARKVVSGFIDARSPYFGRLVLRENDRNREVLIGRSTYLDSRDGIRIVDWRDAPVSRLFYRYNEGDDYEEVFGEREIEGEVLTRRSLAIVESRLRRIVAPQGTFLRPEKGSWKRGGGSIHLKGGQGTATRAEQHHKPGSLGVGSDGGEDKHLKEITALIDPRQFELITSPDSGLVVIQGGAGSGKTTIGLHRLAYLAFRDRRRFRPDKMLVIVFNDALARYISQVLPALDINGVPVRTYQSWASKLRAGHFRHLPRAYDPETPSVVTRFKKHPFILDLFDDYVAELADAALQKLTQAAGDDELQEKIRSMWAHGRARPLVHRLHEIRRWCEQRKSMSRATRHAIERETKAALETARDVVGAWNDVLTDRERLVAAVERHAVGAFVEREVQRVYEWCVQHCGLVTAEVERADQDERDGKEQEKGGPRPTEDGETPMEGIDGAAIEEHATLDREDDTLLLALHQRMRGPLMRTSGKEALVYEHVLIDEAQDLSPVELSVALGTVSKAQSVTLAGDVAQRLYMNNGFEGWDEVLERLDLSHVAVEPLKLSYRSTAEIIEFSRDVLGNLAEDEAPRATRHGAPVELFRFAASGDAAAFLADALRELFQAEPRASVAVIARYPEHADLYFEGLRKAETPNLRRIAEQDFPFKPGIDVTDVRQVKGLEFDYVVLVEVTESTYGEEDEARHLLHIAATRAAHQLWILTSGKPARVLPQALRDRGY